MDSHIATQPKPPRPRTFLFDQYSSTFVRRRLLPRLRPRYRCAIASGFPAVSRTDSRIIIHALYTHALSVFRSLPGHTSLPSAPRCLWNHLSTLSRMMSHMLTSYAFPLLCCPPPSQSSSIHAFSFPFAHIVLSVSFHPVVLIVGPALAFVLLATPLPLPPLFTSLVVAVSFVVRFPAVRSPSPASFFH